MFIEETETIERKGVYKKHFDKFGVDPIEYGIYWNDIDQLEKLILKAIESNIPYDETEEFESNNELIVY